MGIACRRRNIKVVSALLEAGAPLHTTPFLVDLVLNKDGDADRMEMLQFLLSHNYSFEPIINSFTPLMHAAKHMLVDEISLFLTIPAIQNTINYSYNGFTGIIPSIRKMFK